MKKKIINYLLTKNLNSVKLQNFAPSQTQQKPSLANSAGTRT